MKKTQLRQWFKQFANDCQGSSELYEYWSKKIADDDDLLELCSHAREGQPVPNLLFGAVHYLLLKGKDHLLKEYFPSIVSSPRAKEASFVHFKDFCQVYREEIISLLKVKLVQTNEVRRCAYLYPCFCLIYERVKKPLALIEIGTSAGLQLLWDKYSYSYGTDEVYGDKQSNVRLESEVKGGNFPFLLPNSPPVTSRVGVDLHINDLSDPEDYLWLKALIWPEHHDRRERFGQAAQYFNKQSVKLIEGDGVALLPSIVEQMTSDAAICIFHTHVANQMPKEMKLQLIEHIKSIGRYRDVFHIYNNMWDQKLHLDCYINGGQYTDTVGETDGHGRWFTWEL
ncbi:hypothetical protein GCM10010965_15800 [Caldalkalibacillus thermarum]|uniref:DUF2332 domain-containing protein n=1 Tax=Caldalkalibacillus thermarum TaxID=296745 RepID=UPI00166E9BF0|nr:DUF2332 domain-containing protein [Caldalkalibacillus thermarum]GGK23855.1 hypothetical protein GCM10010965_15800 [Caldalkalibacillus thermarum]